jgi:hypothetical protein
MNLLSRSAYILASLAGLAAFSSLPANAESTFSGSSTFTSPSGYTQSVSAELTTTSGIIKGANITTGNSTIVGSPSVTAKFDTFASTPATSAATGTLTLNAIIDTTTTKSIADIVANQLGLITPTTSTVTLDQYTAIVKAAGGNDGLE